MWIAEWFAWNRDRLALPPLILTKHGSHASAQHDTHTCTHTHIWDLAAGLPRYAAFCFCFAAQPFSSALPPSTPHFFYLYGLQVLCMGNSQSSGYLIMARQCWRETEQWAPCAQTGNAGQYVKLFVWKLVKTTGCETPTSRSVIRK